MKATPLAIPEVILLEPKVFGDDRGFFFESFNQKAFQQATGRTDVQFVQDNHSRSRKGVLRGLHYQIHHPQGKLLSVLQGVIFDVVVDLRRSSPTFGQYVTQEVSADNKRIMWIPEGFAHGFEVISDTADVFYKTTDYWAPEFERSIAWNDPDIGIRWPDARPTLSAKDQQAVPFATAECFA